MTDGFVQVAPNSTGDKIRVQQLVNGASATVDMQNIVISDPANLSAMQTVRAGNTAPTPSDGASIVMLRPDGGGTTGLDVSASAPTWPNIGANFDPASPVYASWFLLKTIPSSPGRLKVTIDNMSGAQILCLRDDGTAASGAAPVNATGFILNPKTNVGPEGGHYESSTFRGRIQIFGASTSQFVSAATD